ncbi:MAG: type IV conjugative transfer system protein TraL [Sutterella wadsworthensis]
MAAPEGVRVPTGLDDPPRFLFFDADLVAVVLTVTYLGAVLDHIGAGVFLGALGTRSRAFTAAATAQRSPTGTSARLPSGGRPRARPDTSCAEARPPTVRSERQSLPPIPQGRSRTSAHAQPPRGSFSCSTHPSSPNASA